MKLQNLYWASKHFGSSVVVLIIIASPATAEVLDKMPPAGEMVRTMFIVATLSGILMCVALRLRLKSGLIASALMIWLNSTLLDSSSAVRAMLVREAGPSFAAVYYGRWLLLIAGAAIGLLWRRAESRRQHQASGPDNKLLD